MKLTTGFLGSALSLCVALHVCSVTGVKAQASSSRGESIGRAFLQAGYVRRDIDDVNEDLQAAGLPVLEQDLLSLGGSVFGPRGRFSLGAEGHLLLSPEETTADGNRELDPKGMYGLVHVGYLALSAAGVDVYPAIGLGGGSMELSIVERGAPTFDAVLADPETATELSTKMFILDASLAIHYRFSSERERGFLVGLQGGYAYAPGRTEWRLDGMNDVGGGPWFQIEGPYLRVSLGGWRRQ